MDKKIIAVDFDGTLTNGSKFPDIGTPNYAVIDKVISLQQQGWIAILWTVRDRGHLAKAVQWCKTHGIVFDRVNENYDTRSASPKVYADVYLDDRSMHPADVNRYQDKALSRVLYEHKTTRRGRI